MNKTREFLSKEIMSWTQGFSIYGLDVYYWLVSEMRLNTNFDKLSLNVKLTTNIKAHYLQDKFN